MKSQSTDVLQIEIYIEFEEEMSLCEEMSLSVTLSVIARVADSKSHRQSY